MLVSFVLLMKHTASAVCGKHLSCFLLVTKEEIKMKGPLAYRNLD